MLNTILVPLDGSPLAETALEPAMLLAKRFNAELLLVHSISSEKPSDETEPDPQTYLEYVAGHVRSEDLVARTSRLTMEPAEGIADEAGLSNADLIVMTTHARKGLDALLHPSVTWEVLRQSDAPILACKSASADDPAALLRGLPRFMTDSKSPILVPLDGSPQAEGALPLAEELARAFGNPLLLVSAFEQPSPLYPVGGAWGGAGMGQDVWLMDQAIRLAEEESRRYLNGKQTELASAGLQVQIEVESGPAAFFIQDAARQHQAGLIVMASHGRGWLGRFVLGSVAQSVLREVDTPVLLVRRQPPAEGAVQPSAQPEATDNQPTT